MPKELQLKTHKLKKRKERIGKCITKYGFLPRSLWKIGTKPAALDDYVSDKVGKGSYAGGAWRGKRLSQFHPEVSRRCIIYWSDPGDWVLDPFSARLPRLLVARALRRNSIGQDISKNFFEHGYKKLLVRKTLDQTKVLIEEKDRLRIQDKNGTITETRYGDSRNLSFIPSNFIDLVFASPPYYDLEYYGPEPEQLGHGSDVGDDDKPTYQEFLNGIKEVITECRRTLKSDGYCVWNVQDFRKDGVYYDYHGDTIQLFKEVGYVHHDTVIFNLFSLSQMNFTRCDINKYTAKVHEYIMIFKKGEQ